MISMRLLVWPTTFLAFACGPATEAPPPADEASFPEDGKADTTDGLVFRRDGGVTEVFRNGARIVRWTDTLDWAVMPTYFLMRDTQGESWVFDYQGRALVKWYDSRDYALRARYLLLTDTKGETGVFRAEGTRILRWFESSTHALAEDYFVVSDVKGESWAVRVADGSVITKWYETSTYDLREGYFVFTDTRGEAAVFDVGSGRKLVDWHNYTAHALEESFFVLADQGAITQAFRTDGSSLVKWYQTQEWLSSSEWLALLDRQGALRMITIEGEIVRDLQGIEDIERDASGALRYRRRGSAEWNTLSSGPTSDDAPPRFRDPPAEARVAVGSSLALVLRATGREGAMLQFSFRSEPALPRAAITTHGAEARLDWAPAGNHEGGRYSLVFSVSDGRTSSEIRVALTVLRQLCNSYGCYLEGGDCNSYGCWNASDAGCNSYGCWQGGGGCNSYGCWNASNAGCNSYGCWRNGGGCNSYGCWEADGGCNSYGCWETGGGCNSYGCWTRGGSCTSNGCR